MKIDLNVQPLSSWINTGKQPLLIAGPCSAETEDQLVATAHLLAKTGKVTALRAGIWKPRTRPGEFEGIGSIGLKWLQRAKEETGLPVAIEVATGKHVEEALAAGVDILWVGARSTVNPFTVQEIADALKGVDIPVMVKNPVNPDLSLWIGALERINNAGITKLAAIHRGFSSYEKSAFRNEPMWDMAINLKTHAPHLPIINDPSHISGNRDLIQYVAQKALDLDMQGLMIESHIDPSVAWTDAKQQVTPSHLADIIDALTLRKPETANTEVSSKLDELRKQIDKIDDLLIQKLAERMQIVEKIGQYKKDNGITILQVGRWDEILQKRTGYAKALKLNPEFTEKMLEMIHSESIRKQTEIMSKEQAEGQAQEKMTHA
ncbi:3-deoxy-D-arabinoheptulosonate-7-phosphate synthase [Mucilaginibacter yixingensis]|uniref:chorismate mutase n=1 Tax=Mucilaginibacter yixingensis TaxID=1295612 RepID=A0A2T5JAP2_9SPHI|nr:bifunctional 3-deoxy-7-phosphoheptulonate synthase/chorismate mutase type II [Mucilaginibacter yixingensis]PTQ97934.1 3-deoxy-D-arabinoheptulosonate-7-phosphate synthase [Mucilaginibacter yixingensis]